MKIFLLGMLVMWTILGGLAILNDTYRLKGGLECLDGWLTFLLIAPAFVCVAPIWTIEKILKDLDKAKKI